MSQRDYEISAKIEREYNVPEDFYGVIMAAMRGADTFNLERLKAAWPKVWEELRERYNAPAGLMDGEKSADGKLERRDGHLIVVEEDGKEKVVRAI